MGEGGGVYQPILKSFFHILEKDELKAVTGTLIITFVDTIGGVLTTKRGY
jgi:hypothetical protein